MAKLNDTPNGTAVDPVVLLAAGAAAQNPETAHLLNELLALQLRKAKDEDARVQAAREQELAARKQGAEFTLKQDQAKRIFQTRCQHRHAIDHTPMTSGMKLGAGKISVSCAECGRESSGTVQEMRTEWGSVYPSDEAIGGVS